MILITGGAYQGKTEFAVKKLNISESSIADGKTCSPDTAKNSVCIKNYHELVKRLGNECTEFTENLCRNGKTSVIIIDETGCGIVPLDEKERTWRENTGRCGCIIAENSDTAVRMVCGIPQVIKGVLP